MVVWSLAGLTAGALVSVLVLLVLNVSRVGTGRLTADAIFAVVIGVSAALGQLVISRHPRNAIGWLLSLIALAVASSMLGEQYALHGLAVAGGSLPAARMAGWAAGEMASVTAMLLAIQRHWMLGSI